MNAMKKHIILPALLLLVCSSLFAQSDFRLTEQLFSRINQNPAAIGNNEKIQIFNVNRIQWAGIGFDEAPKSTLINVHSYCDKIQSGFGLSLSYDELGIANSTLNAKLAYAYNIDLWDGGLLSLGLSAGVINKTFDPAKHIWVDPTDPTIPEESISKTNFDLDFGFELSTRYLLVGASGTHLSNIGEEVSTLVAPTHINAYVRGLVPVVDKIDIAPALLYTNIGSLNQGNYSVATTNVLEVNATGFYDNKYWFGLGYRFNSALAFSAGLEWNFLRLGYSYELSVGDVANLSSSTHELMLSFIIPTKK